MMNMYANFMPIHGFIKLYDHDDADQFPLKRGYRSSIIAVVQPARL